MKENHKCVVIKDSEGNTIKHYHAPKWYWDEPFTSHQTLVNTEECQITQ